MLLTCLFVCLQMMQQLYKDCNLVHADLSEYNMLWFEGKVGASLCPSSLFVYPRVDCLFVCLFSQVWLIDVSQSVEPTHPHGLEFLFRDCRNVSTVTTVVFTCSEQTS